MGRVTFAQRPSGEAHPSRDEQTRSEASRTPELVELSTVEVYVDARLHLCTHNCPAFLSYMMLAVNKSTDNIMQHIIHGQRLKMTPLDFAFAVMRPAPISVDKWRHETTKVCAASERRLEAQLRRMDVAIASNARLTDLLISDFALARKRDLLEHTVHFSIDYPDHWQTTISQLYKLPKMDAAPKSIALCVGLEFAARFNSFECALQEPTDFYDDFFKFYYLTFIKSSYTVKKRKKSSHEMCEFSVVPPKIIVITVPLIDSTDYPTSYVRRLNEHIRQMVDERLTMFGMIVLYDWEGETRNVPEFNEDAYRTRFVRLFGYLQHEQTFFNATRTARQWCAGSRKLLLTK